MEWVEIVRYHSHLSHGRVRSGVAQWRALGCYREGVGSNPTTGVPRELIVMRRRREETTELRANPGYAAFQISKALLTVREHGDPETRKRAQRKVEKWAAVLQGMISGRLQVGSRTPVAEFPPWMTLEVLTGGFATRKPLAGGPLQDHERGLLERLAIAETPEARRALNRHYLTDEGLAELTEMVESQRYSVRVPEEGALPAVALLLRKGDSASARTILQEIAALFPQLRFYPAPRGGPGVGGGKVLLQELVSTFTNLKKLQPNPRILAQKEAVEIWAPLYDEAAALVLEAIGPGVPRFREGFRPEDENTEGVKFAEDTGWPGTEYPKGLRARERWRARAREYLDRYERNRRVHRLCAKPDRPGEIFPQLRLFIWRALHGRLGLPADRGGILVIMAQYIEKRGLPQSPECAARRESAIRQVKGPTFHALASVMAERLARHPPDGGIEELDGSTGPLTEAEITRWKTEGSDIPAHLKRKVARSLIATPEELVQRDVITSGETLAEVLPQVTAEILSRGFPDENTRRLYEAVYRAFRRRRSLLLLNLEHQVRFGELPWVQALERLRSRGFAVAELSVTSLRKVALLAITSFPHAILPNKLLQEFQALSEDAGLDLPLTEEVAADIFMRRFSPKYTRAAKRAAVLLQGTLYERYYAIDYPAVQELPEPKTQRRPLRGVKPDPLTELCISRVKLDPGESGVVANGMIIEQEQIITTHNLATLFADLGLVDDLRDRLPEMARRCFRGICHSARANRPPGHARLTMLKETAYAWRQMVFYLALLPVDEQKRFVGWASTYLTDHPLELGKRLSQAVNGLSLAMEGRVLDDRLEADRDVHRFLGWTRGGHWLLGTKEK